MAHSMPYGTLNLTGVFLVSDSKFTTWARYSPFLRRLRSLYGRYSGVEAAAVSRTKDRPLAAQPILKLQRVNLDPPPLAQIFLFQVGQNLKPSLINTPPLQANFLLFLLSLLVLAHLESSILICQKVSLPSIFHSRRLQRPFF